MKSSMMTALSKQLKERRWLDVAHLYPAILMVKPLVNTMCAGSLLWRGHNGLLTGTASSAKPGKVWGMRVAERGPACKGLPVEDLHFDSTDLAATEEFLVKAYTKMRIGGHGDGARTRVQRRWLGSVSIDDLSVTFDMQLNARPLER